MQRKQLQQVVMLSFKENTLWKHKDFAQMIKLALNVLAL